jgi:hypothetical protein
MVRSDRDSFLDPPGSGTLKDICGGFGYVVIGIGLVVYWMLHPNTWKTVTGGAVLIVLGLYFLRRAWRTVRGLE